MMFFVRRFLMRVFIYGFFVFFERWIMFFMWIL